MRWETHCHTVYSNGRRRRFDALNTPREMIETAMSRGLHGLIITDHDSVKGGLVGRSVAKSYTGFRVIPGAEVTSVAGHVLAIGVETDVRKGLGVEETVEIIHDLGGVAVASHPFSRRAKSVKEECVKADAVEVFNSHNTEVGNGLAFEIARKYSKPWSAGSDAHWTRTLGRAGIVCDNPVEDLARGRARIFGEYTSIWENRLFQVRQILSGLAGRAIS